MDSSLGTTLVDVGGFISPSIGKLSGLQRLPHTRLPVSVSQDFDNNALEANDGKPLRLYQKAFCGLTAGAIGIGYRYGVKQVTPSKDQNRLRKTERKQPIAETVQEKSLNDVEAESEVKHEIMEFDFKQSSMELVNPTVCSKSASFSDKNEVEEESPIVHLVCESSEHFSDKEVVESSQSYSDKEIIEEALIASTVSESSESFYDDAVLENESDYNNEGEVSEEESETANLNEMQASVVKLRFTYILLNPLRSIQKNGDGVRYALEGWPIFMKENNLNRGDILHFTYNFTFIYSA